MKTVALALITLVLSSMAFVAQGEPSKFGECPNDRECETMYGWKGPPDLVTGHTVFARWVVETRAPSAQDEPPPHSALPRGGADESTATSTAEGLLLDMTQAECVTWFDGKNLDVRPDPDPWFSGATHHSNDFFSDEDETISNYGGWIGDNASQDYDPDPSVDTCVPEIRYSWDWDPSAFPTDFAAFAGFGASRAASDPRGTYEFPRFAVIVEKGDCSPITGVAFRFRGHLDYVDPNNIYHEVQEYDYVCPHAATAAELMTRTFPWTYTGHDQKDACALYETPAEGGGRFDWGHKCNGSIQDLVTERLWITPVHAAVFDRTANTEYNFALSIDTCSGVNINELPFFGGLEPHDVDAADHFLDALMLGLPLVEACHDGSSWSFDDTGRGRVTHDTLPWNNQERMRGNAFDSDANSTTFGMHRQTCRSNYADWAYNDHPGRNRAASGPASLRETVTGERPPRHSVGDGCYAEDHKTARIDVYTFDHDVTGGLFAAHMNNLTGMNTYVEGLTTGPNYLPPIQP